MIGVEDFEELKIHAKSQIITKILVGNSTTHFELSPALDESRGKPVVEVVVVVVVVQAATVVVVVADEFSVAVDCAAAARTSRFVVSSGSSPIALCFSKRLGHSTTTSSPV